MADLLLYDGTCGLCQRSVQLVLRHDRRGRFRFAPLQGPTATDVLHRHGLDPADLDTVVAVEDPGGPGERVRVRGRAVVYVLRALGGGFRLAALLGFLPTPLLDAAYRLVARRRYRWFGRADACALPSPEQRARFVDSGAADRE
jgi:predicted DCC family thiol-disulfide oxidoreductase YuxK